MVICSCQEKSKTKEKGRPLEAKNMSKTFNFGKIDARGTGRRINPVEVNARLERMDDGKYRFVASAMVYNQTKTDCVCAGQCLDFINERLNDSTFKQLYHLWKLYHLNDMHAGTPEQEIALERCQSKDYDDRCNYLKLVGLYEVEYDGKPYKYGHGWLYQPIPDDDFELIVNLLS